MTRRRIRVVLVFGVLGLTGPAASLAAQDTTGVGRPLPPPDVVSSVR